MNSIDFRVGLLRCFNELNNYIEQADTSVFNKALGTHNFNAGVKEDTYSQVADILKIIHRKNLLLAVKNAIVKALNGLRADKRNLLLCRYVKKLDTATLLRLFNVTKGAYYARLNKALDDFEEQLNEQGYDKAWFCANYASKLWFRRLIGFGSATVFAEQAGGQR